MARNEQLIRQHKILQILEHVRYGKTLEEIQAEVSEDLGILKVSSRTLRRDIEALQVAGFDLAAHESPRGKVWKLGALGRSPAKISFTATELIALSLGRQLMHPLAGTPFWQDIESFWSKIQDAVPEPVMKHYQRYRKALGVLGVPAKSYEKQHKIIQTINRGILEHRFVEIEYQSLSTPKRLRLIEPYRIVLFQSSLYAIGFDCEDSNPETRLRPWKVDRMTKAILKDEYFEPQEDDLIDQYVGNTMQMFVRSKTSTTFVIRLSPQAAMWVREDPIHAEQSVKELDDGSVELTVEAVHEMEIIPRVLSMGDNAEILAPESARRAMAEVVQRMAVTYSK